MTPPAKPPRVSVFVASYNGERYVEESVRSVLGQTFRDLELVVVDDGSRAPTLDILRRLAAEDQRMRLIEGTHRGQIGTLNHAIEHCRGELLARLDHDDNCLPERIARQVAYMDTHPDVVAIGSATQRIDEHGKYHGDARTKEAAARTDPSTLPPTLVFLMGPTLMTRASAMRAIGGYRPQFRAAEDRDISWRLAAVGRTMHVTDVLVAHRDHSGSMGVTQQRTQAFGALLCDLSAIANHFKRDETEALAAIEPGGDYTKPLTLYTRLLDPVYPVETLLLSTFMKPRFAGMDGVPSPKELTRRVMANVGAKPWDAGRLRLLPRLVRLARR